MCVGKYAAAAVVVVAVARDDLIDLGHVNRRMVYAVHYTALTENPLARAYMRITCTMCSALLTMMNENNKKIKEKKETI